ncbi:MAG: PAS domain S-box protein [Bacteroidota bacterium]
MVFGHDLPLMLERKIQILLTFLIGLMACLGFFFTIVLNMNPWLMLLAAVSTALIFGFFLIARNSDNYRRSIFPLFITSIALLSVAWLFNGGYDGNIMTLMFVMFLMLYVILPQRSRPVLFIAYIVMISALVIAQHYYPGIVIGYDNDHQRFIDMLFSNLFYLILFYYLIDVIVKNYADENTKTALINEELQRKNSEIAENIARLEASEAKYHQLYSLQRLMGDTMPDLIWAKDLDKKYIFANKAICEKLLMASDTTEPIGKTDIFFAERERALHQDEPQWHTFGELCQDSDEVTLRELKEMQFNEFGNVRGKFLYLDVHKAPLYDTEGNLIGIVGSARDVTEQKRIEETLQLSHHALESFSEFLTITDLNDRFTYVNQAFVNAYGYSREEILGKTPAILWSKNNREGLIEEILSHSKTGNWTGEVLNIDKDGREFLVTLSTSQVKDPSGNIIGLVGISKDITIQKRAEELLRASEERQRFILESMPVAIYSSPVDPDIDTAWISGNVLKITGFTNEEYLSEPHFWRNRIHPDDAASVLSSYSAMKANSEMILEYRWRRADGQYHWFQDRFTLKVTEGKKEYFGILVDISERMQMEKALLQNELKYRSIVENLHQVYYEADGRAVITYCNQELFLFSGFTQEELIGTSALRLVIDEHRQRVSEAYDTWKNDRIEHSSVEFIVQRKNGERLWVEQSTHFEFDDDGRFIKGANLVKNIEQRKAAEDALKDSEIFFRSVWQHTASGMRITDENGTVVRVNNAYCEMVGMPEKDIVGASFSMIYAEQDRVRIVQKHQDRFRVRAVPGFMQKNLTLWNGTTIWVEVSNSFMDLGDSQTLLLGVFTDVTNRKNSELALRESEERWQFALEGAGDGVWDWNCVTNEVLFSHNWKAMLGYSDDEISSHLEEWSKRVHQDDLKRVTESLTNSLNKESKYYQSEHRMLCKDGTYKWILDRGMVIEWGENDTPLRMIGTHTDISELKKSEQIIRDIQRRESIGVLAGGIAHDFNNLLTAIIGNVSLAQLRVDGQSPVIHQNLERAMSAAERAATLSKQMLAYSGKGKFQFVQIDLNHMIDECIGLFEASLPKNVAIVKHLSPQPVHVKGDPGQIEQIVMNLIINAGEAVGTKNGVVNISVVTMDMTDEMLKPFSRLNNQILHGGKYAMFQVTDTGIGMDGETLGKIFDPFFTTKFVGRGLGLSAVLGIIRGHNGGITVSSKEHAGTIFQVVLPLVTAGEIVTAPQHYDSASPDHTMTILVIDDEQYIIDMTKDVLERGQYRFHTAVDPEIGLKIFAEHWRSIDMVLLDYSMPKLNGKEVLIELRKIHPNIKVVMSSGYSEEEIDHLMGDVKPNTFIQKPHRPQTLLSAINAILVKT